jgi:PilZ domain
MGGAMSVGTAVERRSSPRCSCAQCAWLIAARLRPGRDVRVLDLSSGGALVEAAVRLLPGAPFVLHLVSTRGAHTIRGTVLRCHVSAVDRSTGVRYRAALGFDGSFRMPDDRTGDEGAADISRAPVLATGS